MMVITKTSQAPQSFEQLQLFMAQEKSSPYTHHDLLFKQLIQTFFIEFMEAFFPELHQEIDFKSFKFLSEEVITDSYDGDKRILDIVVEVKWKKTDAVIVVHVEPQSYKQINFNKRMFTYFSLLYHQVDKPIIPIAIFSYDEDWDENEFQMKIGHLDILRFKYLTLHLRKINWRNFIHKENPVSAALLSKMGYNKKERIKVKIEFFRILSQLKINLEKRDILVSFFDSYLQLNEEEEEIFVQEVSKLENAEEILKIPISYEERGKEIGRAEGIEEGRKEGRQEGRKEGRKEGLQTGKKEVALEMLKQNFTLDEINKLTKLTKEQIEQLRKQL